MLCGGFRANEVLTLPEDAWYEELVSADDGELVCDEDGQPLRRCALRYWPEKGGSGQTLLKAIPTVMAEVAERAYKRALELTEDSRAVAKAQVERFGTTVLGTSWDLLPDDDLLRSDQIADAVDLQGESRSGRGREFLQANNVPHEFRKVTIKGRIYSMAFARKADVYSKLYELSDHGNCFPNDSASLYPHECLFLVRHHSKLAHPGIKGTVRVLSYGSLVQYLTPATKSKTFFRRLGYERAGETLEMATRGPRNLLNVLAIEGKLSDLELAHWMGRVDVRSNGAYYKMPEHRRATAAAALLYDGLPYHSAAQLEQQPLGRAEVLATEGRGHVTEAGACERDLGDLPCPRHTEMVALRQGRAGPNELDDATVAALVSETIRLIEASVLEVAEGSVYAEEWLAAHKAFLVTLVDGHASGDQAPKKREERIGAEQ